MKKKDYIAPEALAFKLHLRSALLIGSPDLGAPESVEDVTPSTEPPQNDVFNGRGLDW